jgi:nickel superoxide dismutase
LVDELASVSSGVESSPKGESFPKAERMSNYRSKEGDMGIFKPSREAYAHCDLFCGVYDPAQARIEAQSVLKAAQKYHDSDDAVFQARCVAVKESQAELVKHHLSVLWTDFFKPHHLEAFPELHGMFWNAIKAAGDAKKSMDVAVSEDLIAKIEAISEIFWKTDEAPNVGLYPPA